MSASEAHAYLFKQFQGYRASDIEFLTTLRDPDPPRHEHWLTDFFGMCLDTLTEPSIAHRVGEHIDRPPFPTDGWLAEGVEYAGLALALQHAQGSFTAVELGAGFGPWITLSAICARRMGKAPIHLIGVEADHDRFALMRRHLEQNGILPAAAGVNGRHGTLSWDLRQAIVWGGDDEVLWPQGGHGDAGLRATALAEAGARDYRGFELKTARQHAVSLDALLRDAPVVDLLHIDIQGAEHDVLKGGIAAVNERVKFMMVACHSRLIEGQVMELLFSQGWFLERQEPCSMTPAVNPPSLEGMTFMDGSQVWRNLRFSQADLWVKAMRPPQNRTENR